MNEWLYVNLIVYSGFCKAFFTQTFLTMKHEAEINYEQG